VSALPPLSGAPRRIRFSGFAKTRAVMASSLVGLHRLDNTIWILIALVAASMLVTANASGFTIILESFIVPGSVCLLVKLGAHYYGRRKDYDLAAALESTAQLIAFSAVAAPLSYVAATAALPLQDATLAKLDQAFGFDWKAWLTLIYSWPRCFKLMHLAYSSLSLQMIAAVLLLGFTGRLVRLRVYMLAFIFAALVTIAISALLPAEGAWLHYEIANPTVLPISHTSWPVFLGLRDRSFHTLMGIGAEGIITFPSLHAALAAILMMALWPVQIARWIAVIVNVLMILATPIDGSHYLTDVLAGIIVAGLCFVAARTLVAQFTAPVGSLASSWK
jgi:membrane-associated phospholipid phosphatase